MFLLGVKLAGNPSNVVAYSPSQDLNSMEGAFSQNIPLFITFVDFKKAFDSIDRDMMFAILQNYGIPDKIVSAIRVLCDQSTSQVYIQGQLSEPFAITTGVLQGDILAPFLFIIVIYYVSKRFI